MSEPEFSRPLRIDTLGSEPRRMEIAAEEAERAALAQRFGFVSIDRLSAELDVWRTGDEVRASGHIEGRVVQTCVASGQPVPEEVDARFDIFFRPQPARAREEDEVELSHEEMDVVFYDGASIDVGEAVAESLSLSLDPYPRAPGADSVLQDAGVKSEEEAGPFGALAALRDKLK